ncbi:uncharacterized protein LOC135327226 [Dromaius novaehollandiae]|uniref:uncharacterized protein LOC135327226 n=1 Tax=Dromaius novaehollandiae TaxID=8790 RepID=UPI00311D3514
MTICSPGAAPSRFITERRATAPGHCRGNQKGEKKKAEKDQKPAPQVPEATSPPPPPLPRAAFPKLHGTGAERSRAKGLGGRGVPSPHSRVGGSRHPIAELGGGSCHPPLSRLGGVSPPRARRPVLLREGRPSPPLFLPSPFPPSPFLPSPSLLSPSLLPLPSFPLPSFPLPSFPPPPPPAAEPWSVSAPPDGPSITKSTSVSCKPGNDVPIHPAALQTRRHSVPARTWLCRQTDRRTCGSKVSREEKKKEPNKNPSPDAPPGSPRAGSSSSLPSTFLLVAQRVPRRKAQGRGLRHPGAAAGRPSRPHGTRRVWGQQRNRGLPASARAPPTHTRVETGVGACSGGEPRADPSQKQTGRAGGSCQPPARCPRCRGPPRTGGVGGGGRGAGFCAWG